MKMQDLGFGLIFLIAFWLHSPKIVAILGIIFLLLAALLFRFWIFFTAERFTWYGAGFLMLSILKNLKLEKKG